MKGEEVLVKYQDGESFGVHDAARDVLEACGVHGAPLLKVCARNAWIAAQARFPKSANARVGIPAAMALPHGKKPIL